jgi:hypothetical protein
MIDYESKEAQEIISMLRVRLDDLQQEDLEFGDSYLAGHIYNNLVAYEWDLPLKNPKDKILLVVESMIDIITALKVWADGESYSYKNDAIQITRGLMSKHFQDTIKLLKEERNDILLNGGGFA